MNKVIKKIRFYVWCKAAFFLPTSLYILIKFKQKVGYWPNLKKPKTFCEKIQVLKMRSKDHPEFTKMVDKVEAKNYVASIIGQKYIIPTLGVWDKFDDIDFESLPNGYILKCTHDSSKGVVVLDKSKIDKIALKKRLKHFLHKNYYLQNREYPYKKVPHRIIAEKFLVNGTDKELKDYKFFCFNGKAKYCQIIANRSTEETIDFYDRNWTHQEFIGLIDPNSHIYNSVVNHKKPLNYQEMLTIADRLASAIDFPFVRIDQYNVNGNIYFGEITFFPAGGMGLFNPEKWDCILGNMLNIDGVRQ